MRMSQHSDMMAWRSWAEAAPPELRALFDEQNMDVLREVRRHYPPDCGPDHGSYQEMKGRCSRALLELTQSIGEADAVD